MELRDCTAKLLSIAITGIGLLQFELHSYIVVNRLFSAEPARETALGFGCLLLDGVVELVL